MLFLYISKTKHNRNAPAGQTNELIPTTLYQRPSCLVVVINHRTRRYAAIYDHLLGVARYSLSVDLIRLCGDNCASLLASFLASVLVSRRISSTKKRYMLLAITAFASGFIAIPLANNVTLVVLFLPLLTAPIPFLLPC